MMNSSSASATTSTHTPLNSQDSRDEHDGHHHHDHDQLMGAHSQGSLAQMVVKAATVCNKMLLDNCSLCTMYCDKQVQYETVLEPYYTSTTSATVGGLFHRLDELYNHPQEVESFRSNMFDEESVVEQVNSRTEDDQ